MEGSTRGVTLCKTGARVGLTLADRMDGGAGVVVVGLAPGGLAIRQLKLGDTILSVGGELATTHSQAIARVDASRSGALSLAVGPPVGVRHLNSVLGEMSSSSDEKMDAASPSCAPVFTRHEPLQERKNAF